MEKKTIFILFFVLFLVGCSQASYDEIDELLASNSGLKYSTIVSQDYEKFNSEIDYSLDLDYNDFKLYMEDSKHYSDSNYDFSLFFPEEFKVMVYDNQIIATSENMDIKIRMFSKEVYNNSNDFYNDLFDLLNKNITNDLDFLSSNFERYNVTSVDFSNDDIKYFEHLIDKETYFFNVEFLVKSEEIREKYIMDYFYNTILLPVYD